MTSFPSRLCFSFLAVCSAALAQTGNYVPLDPGNVWVYRMARPSPFAGYRTIMVEGRETVNGFEYSRVRFFERTVLLRALPDGSILAYNPETASDVTWLALDSPAGTGFETRHRPMFE